MVYTIKHSQYSDYATGWTIRCSILDRGKRFSLLQNVQTVSRAHLASSSTGKVVLLRFGGKTAGT